MTRHLLLSMVLALALATTAAADAGDQIRKLLNDANLEYQLLDNGACKLVIEFTDGRSQLVFLRPMEPMNGQDLVEIYSPVMKIRYPLEEKVARRLLTSSGLQKIGYFGIEEVEQGENEASNTQPTVFAYHNLPLTGLTGEVVNAVIHTVAEVADEMEKEQLGAGSDEY
ncbi:MAG: YbjN domain-containing protein [Thermoanaerobaculia bacterium]|nr:YbjN domain-containing protein [Thermoanaerobaculia bacterium]